MYCRMTTVCYGEILINIRGDTRIEGRNCGRSISPEEGHVIALKV